MGWLEEGLCDIASYVATDTALPAESELIPVLDKIGSFLVYLSLCLRRSLFNCVEE